MAVILQSKSEQYAEKFGLPTSVYCNHHLLRAINLVCKTYLYMEDGFSLNDLLKMEMSKESLMDWFTHLDGCAIQRKVKGDWQTSKRSIKMALPTNPRVPNWMRRRLFSRSEEAMNPMDELLLAWVSMQAFSLPFIGGELTLNDEKSSGTYRVKFSINNMGFVIEVVGVKPIHNRKRKRYGSTMESGKSEAQADVATERTTSRHEGAFKRLQAQVSVRKDEGATRSPNLPELDL